jgi:hypothetical protein
MGLVFLAGYLVRYPSTKFSIDKKPSGNKENSESKGDVE